MSSIRSSYVINQDYRLEHQENDHLWSKNPCFVPADCNDSSVVCFGSECKDPLSSMTSRPFLSCCDCGETYHVCCVGVISTSIDTITSPFRCADCRKHIANLVELQIEREKFIKMIKNEMMRVELENQRMKLQMETLANHAKELQSKSMDNQNCIDTSAENSLHTSDDLSSRKFDHDRQPPSEIFMKIPNEIQDASRESRIEDVHEDNGSIINENRVRFKSPMENVSHESSRRDIERKNLMNQTQNNRRMTNHGSSNGGDSNDKLHKSPKEPLKLYDTAKLVKFRENFNNYRLVPFFSRKHAKLRAANKIRYRKNEWKAHRPPSEKFSSHDANVKMKLGSRKLIERIKCSRDKYPFSLGTFRAFIKSYRSRCIRDCSLFGKLRTVSDFKFRDPIVIPASDENSGQISLILASRINRSPDAMMMLSRALLLL
jgi:hypothetical protein